MLALLWTSGKIPLLCVMVDCSIGPIGRFSNIFIVTELGKLLEARMSDRRSHV